MTVKRPAPIHCPNCGNTQFSTIYTTCPKCPGVRPIAYIEDDSDDPCSPDYVPSAETLRLARSIGVRF